jgi:hypothetical protein
MLACKQSSMGASQDKLRQAADGIVFGFSGRREILPVQAVMFGPRTGFGAAALRQARSWAIFVRALKVFCEQQRTLLCFVVLENPKLTPHQQREALRRRDRGNESLPT